MKTLLVAASILFTVVPVAHAAIPLLAQNPPPGGNPSNPFPGGNPGETVKLINPLGPGLTTLPALISKVLEFVVYIGSFIVIFMLVYVGFLFVVARGDSAKLTTARQALLWTLIGALILLGAQVIAKGIEATVTALGGN